MVIIFHDNEGMKPWFMSPNLYFTRRRCQNRVQGNIHMNTYEISINAHTYIHIDIYIYMHIYIHMCTLKQWLGEQFTISVPVITMLNLTLGSAAITGEYVFLWSYGADRVHFWIS